MQVTVEIPDELVDRLVPRGRNALRFLFEQTVASAYGDARLPIGQIRQVLGTGTRIPVDGFLQTYEVYDYARKTSIKTWLRSTSYQRPKPADWR